METKTETKLWKRLAIFFTPIISGLIVVIIVGLFLEENLQLKYWSLTTAYIFPPLGKESVIPTGVAVGIHPIIIALTVAMVDILVAIFLIYNYNLAKKIPFIGKFMEKVENIGKSSSDKYGWIKPLRFIGIVLFVMVPFQGSGGLVGSIIGRLIGMKPWNTFFAITIGAITGTLLIAYFADAILSVFVKNFLFGVLIVIILLVIGLMVLMNRRSKNSVKK